MLNDNSLTPHLVAAGFAVIIAYPLLYAFLRWLKKVPLRFNVAVFAAVVAAGLLPLEFGGFMANRSSAQLNLTITLMSAEQSARDALLVCNADPLKVAPGRLKDAAARLANANEKWVSLKDRREITPAQWLELENKCDGWLGRRKPDAAAAAFKRATEDYMKWVVAVLVTGVIGCFALYDLAVSRVREDLREAKEEGRVELEGLRDVAFVVGICVVAFVPFSLMWARLFKIRPRLAAGNKAEKIS
ncbi:hypothetical protein QZM25_28265 [Burkholderia contaminans]|uniref:hypothetical protein n=1 Tax=Burkholderia cepacia complex TaxID=87882 RepID=UPI001CF4A992|nr:MULTISPECIES: hypothetical protein [Burkholderia cepacia complex]MCA7889760.1 hypothetical protein [Burkholderia contaminans]MDN7576512.1 hypothetical protein [Burkholderia contaminans]MDN7670662.1 hypothetical protein [Burkholderia vietnamiensis]